MIDINKRAKEVLEKGYILNLGTQDAAGVWVAAVLYICDEEMNLYWMSSPNFRHSQAISLNPNVSGAITVSSKNGEKDFGVQLSGTAVKLSGLHPELAMKYFSKKGKPKTEKIVKVLRDGYDWYKLTPNKIELIDELNFKFEKQNVL